MQLHIHAGIKARIRVLLPSKRGPWDIDNGLVPLYQVVTPLLEGNVDHPMLSVVTSSKGKRLKICINCEMQQNDTYKNKHRK